MINMHLRAHTNTPRLDLFADPAAADQDVVSKETKFLPQGLHFSHSVSVIKQVRIQNIKVQKRLVLYLSQQLKGLSWNLNI